MKGLLSSAIALAIAVSCIETADADDAEKPRRLDPTLRPIDTKAAVISPTFPPMPRSLSFQSEASVDKSAALEASNAGVKAGMQGNFDQAIRYANEACRKDPTNRTFMINLSAVLLRYGNQLKKAGKSKEALSCLLEALYADYSNMTARKIIESLIAGSGKNTLDSRAWIELAYDFEDSGHFRNASICYRRAAQLEWRNLPEDIFDSKLRGADLVSAFDKLKSLVAPTSSLTDSKTLGQCHRALAAILRDFATVARAQGRTNTADCRLNNASQEYRRALAFDGSDRSSLYGLMDVCCDAISRTTSSTFFVMLAGAHRLDNDLHRAQLRYENAIDADASKAVSIRQFIASMNNPESSTSKVSTSPATPAKPVVSTQKATSTEQLSISKQSSSRDTAANAPIKDKWALVVGVSKFKDPRLNLKYAADDAKAFANFLTTSGNFRPDHVAILTDAKATRAQILSLLGDRWLPRVARPDDFVVIYFSTHGSPGDFDIVGTSYLVAHDTEPSNLYATGISMQDLGKIIKARTFCNRVLIVLDCCHSGAATPGAKGLVRESSIDADELSQGSGQLVICSSSPDQRSWESKRYIGSVFTKYLIETLKQGGNDVRLGTAFDRVKEQVEEEVQRDRGELQTPVLKSQWEGKDLLLLSRPVQPRPGLTLDGSKPGSGSN